MSLYFYIKKSLKELQPSTWDMWLLSSVNLINPFITYHWGGSE